MQQLAAKVLQGDRRSVARVITLVENEDPARQEILRDLFPYTGQAFVIGITGSPGAGKSSLVDELTKSIRQENLTVGIIAVDPSSPFSGGALLGDRIRMQEHALDRGVFIRSMGTRGNLGGLARATKDVVKVLDAYGCQVIIIETVGVGQSELDIMNYADSTVVVLTPGAGDHIQTIKAGIMEIADIFVINKCDLGGAEKIKIDIEGMLDLSPLLNGWRPPVVLTSTLQGTGIDQLWQELQRHRRECQISDKWRQKQHQRMQQELVDIVQQSLHQKIIATVQENSPAAPLLEQVFSRQLDPYTAADLLLRNILH
ncbi:MAG: methylmalonyl Co-A mutase-associated GTPase MeaB [Desulfurispora sp.]|uniref:methylmalonyl Co-A mutase-associated GTPase MeaB n=1 Tax=Desulfurispora sp. TaxID=3014275 RepID=UPI00404AF45A